MLFVNLRLSLLKTEDKPLLPITMDGGVDQREWTLQHRKAADISHTPPQDDLDAGCLDVNVKGPGEKKLSLCLKINFLTPLESSEMPLPSRRWVHPPDGSLPA